MGSVGKKSLPEVKIAILGSDRLTNPHPDRKAGLQILLASPRGCAKPVDGTCPFRSTPQPCEPPAFEARLVAWWWGARLEETLQLLSRIRPQVESTPKREHRTECRGAKHPIKS